jgi:hypothetical protein
LVKLIPAYIDRHVAQTSINGFRPRASGQRSAGTGAPPRCGRKGALGPAAPLHRDYGITDEADLEQLLQACQAVDLIETGNLDARSELAGRNFVVKTLRNLFPDEPERGPGRPPRIGGAW